MLIKVFIINSQSLLFLVIINAVIKVKDDIKEALKASVAVMMGYIVLGMAFGMLLESNGYHVGYAFLMSFLIYAGSMQFVAIDLLSGGATLIQGAIMAFLINARHMVYGLSMLKKFREMKKYKLYMIFSLTDETYSLLIQDHHYQGHNEKRFMFLISLLNQSYWIAGSVIGALLGEMMTINTTGLDFAMTALFVVIVTEQFLSQDNHLYSYWGFVISIASLLIFKADAFIIPAMIGIIMVLLFMYLRRQDHA